MTEMNMVVNKRSLINWYGKREWQIAIDINNTETEMHDKARSELNSLQNVKVRLALGYGFKSSQIHV